MENKLLWSIPTVIFLICVLCNYINNDYTSEFGIIFMLSVCIEFLFAPCFYVYIIEKNKYTKIALLKAISCAFMWMLINAIIAAPNSILHYLNIKRLGVHDIDFFPLCVVCPLILFIIALIVIKTVSIFLTDKKDEQGR